MSFLRSSLFCLRSEITVDPRLILCHRGSEEIVSFFQMLKMCKHQFLCSSITRLGTQFTCLWYRSCSWTMLFTFPMDNSHAADKSQMVTCLFSKIRSSTHAGYASVLDVLVQLVRSSARVSRQPYWNSVHTLRLAALSLFHHHTSLSIAGKIWWGGNIFTIKIHCYFDEYDTVHTCLQSPAFREKLPPPWGSPQEIEKDVSSKQMVLKSIHDFISHNVIPIWLSVFFFQYKTLYRLWGKTTTVCYRIVNQKKFKSTCRRPQTHTLVKNVGDFEAKGVGTNDRKNALWKRKPSRTS
jgi:hypothetical protein